MFKLGSSLPPLSGDSMYAPMKFGMKYLDSKVLPRVTLTLIRPFRVDFFKSTSSKG